jgi:hypothetical protein
MLTLRTERFKGRSTYTSIPWLRTTAVQKESSQHLNKPKKGQLIVELWPLQPSFKQYVWPGQAIEGVIATAVPPLTASWHYYTAQCSSNHSQSGVPQQQRKERHSKGILD